MLLYLFIWEHFISRIIEYSFHKVTHQTAIVMVVLLVIMLAIGVSISVAVGLSSALAMLCMLDANISFATFAQRLFAGANSFSLIAIPFFILAGNIMNNGGIAERIVNVAKVVAGRMPGALAQSNVVANMLFGAISGSGAAAAAAMGGTIGPMEKKEGYDPVYSAGVNIASAPTGMLIPPSNLMIVYSTIAGSVSVAALFMGGYVPGILWGLLVMFLAGVKAKKRGYVAERRIPAKDAMKIILDAIPSLFGFCKNDGYYYVYDRIILYYVMGYGIYRFAGSDRKWKAFYYRKQICDFDFNEYYFVDRRNLYGSDSGGFDFYTDFPANLSDVRDASGTVWYYGHAEPLYWNNYASGRLYLVYRSEGRKCKN